MKEIAKILTEMNKAIAHVNRSKLVPLEVKAILTESIITACITPVLREYEEEPPTQITLPDIPQFLR